MYKNELYHHGVKGMKWGVRRRQKIQSNVSNKLKWRARNANERVSMARDALKSNDPDYIKNSVHPRDSKNLKTAKRALNSDIEYWSRVGERAVAKNKELMSMNINEISTRDYKRRVKELAG